MKKLKLAILILVLVVLILITLFWVFIYTPTGERVDESILPKEPVSSEGVEKAEAQEDFKQGVQPSDANKPETPADVNKPTKPDEPNEPIDPNQIMEALNLKDVEMKDIIQKLADWTGKVIIPDDEAMKQKITIYSPRKLPRREAISLIYSVLRTKGIVAEYTDNAVYLKPIADARLGAVPTIPADYPLAGVENKSQVVQKFFNLKNYSPTQMNSIILPLIGEYGYVSADEDAGSLLVIDTVENLMRIERIIAQFDIPGAEATVTKIFTIHDGDPGEIVQLLRLLLSDGKGRTKKPGSAAPAKARPKEGPKPQGGKPKAKTAAASVIIESSDVPVVLIAEQKRRWIIAKGSPEDIEQIGEWIEKLDIKEEIETEYETVPITYVDVREVSERLNQAMQKMPGTELRRSVLIQPLTQARQIMIFGRAEIREMLKKLIEEIDVPSGQFEQETFLLEHADPEDVKEKIEELYGEADPSGRYSYSYYRYGRQGLSPADMVKAIAFPTMRQVTVIASPENMVKIREQIAQWDTPLDVDRVKPRIIELRNSDPVQMADLLSRLFSEETVSGRRPWWWYFTGSSDEKKKIVGALYGQLTFEAVPDTKKIIVISKIPQAYDVIEDLVAELDSMETAELPMIVTLNYADAEDLCDQLNAILNETGTLSPIRRSKKELSEYALEEGDDSKSAASKDDSDSTGLITPWWNKARSRADEEMPTSNLIGRIRFIPVHRSKAVMVLSPVEYQQSIREIISELDKPGRQVMVKAIILEVNHSDMTSLGIQLASDISAFGNLGENAVTALTQLSLLETHGSLTLEASVNVNTLVDMLVKEAHAKIINQPTLWTKDNEEAEFFKGQRIAFLESSQRSAEGTATSNEFKYEKVGVTLRIRPNITPEKNVDMTINLIISQVEPELINTQVARSELNTTTHLIVEDGQTIMMGGILFRNEIEIDRKLPLLGDVPVIGGLFHHYDYSEANNELLVFVTPYVIDDPNSMLPETVEELERGREKLQDTLDQLQNITGDADID